ncbi:MAG: Rrf2 family transcriptional regulator [Alphaproteobacteria bacterium]
MAYYGAAVEYALHTLLNLSHAPAEISPSARDLAEFQRLPVPFMRKLLTQLDKAGLIAGAEGVHGGWRLARGPEAITLLAAAEAVQPGAPLFECRDIRARCALWDDADAPASATTGTCEIHAAMLAAETAMRRELASRTLADIAIQVHAKTKGRAGRSASEWLQQRYADRRTRDGRTTG